MYEAIIKKIEAVSEEELQIVDIDIDDAQDTHDTYNTYNTHDTYNTQATYNTTSVGNR